MTAMEVIQELLAVLDAERVAIRNIDPDAVEHAAAKKQEAIERLRAFDAADIRTYARELAELRAGLRRNGILLAHARACLRMAMEGADRPRFGKDV
jgi:hypothetical protein